MNSRKIIVRNAIATRMMNEQDSHTNANASASYAYKLKVLLEIHTSYKIFQQLHMRLLLCYR